MDLVANFALLSSIQVEPFVYEEAMTKPMWVDAMNEEMRAIEKNDTWKLFAL